MNRDRINRPRIRSVRAHRGQALVEFAVVTLVVYLLLAATIEFGRAYLGDKRSNPPPIWQRRTLAHAAATDQYVHRRPLQQYGPQPGL